MSNETDEAGYKSFVNIWRLTSKFDSDHTWFSRQVALHAKRFSQYAAAKIFGVARRRIFDWMRQIPKLEELIAKGHMKKMTGRGPRNRDIDRALYDWYCEKREGGE